MSNRFFSSTTSLSESVGMDNTNFEISFRIDDFRGETEASGTVTVAMKSVCSPFTASSPLVSYQTLKPPLLPIFSPPAPILMGQPVSSSVPPVAPPNPASWISHSCSSAVPSSSQMRSHGRTMKSLVMTSRTSLSLNNSQVPLVLVRSSGARIVGRGLGRLVRCGFCARVASRAGLDSGGVMR